MILTKSSKSKNQVVHEQKFKNPLGTTCQVSSETRVLDLESEVPGSIFTGGNILSLESLCANMSFTEFSKFGESWQNPKMVW